MKTFLSLFVFAGFAAAAELVSGPVVGLIGEGGNVYRVLRGGPGSLELGDAVMLPEGVAKSQVAPRQGWILVEREGALAAFEWQQGRVFDLGLSAADAVGFSPSGHEAAFFYRETARLVVMAGLPAQARIVRDEKRGDLFQDVRGLAVSDGGATVVAYAGSRLLRLESAAAVELHVSDDITGFAFVPGSASLLIADRIRNAVLLAGAEGTRVVLSAEQGLDDPDGVWAGMNGRVAVGSYKRGQVWLQDGGEWRIENIEGLARMEETQLRDTLLLSGGPVAALANWNNAEQRIYALPRRVVEE